MEKQEFEAREEVTADMVIGSMNYGSDFWFCRWLQMQGYGDVKAVVREFAEKLIEKNQEKIDLCRSMMKRMPVMQDMHVIGISLIQKEIEDIKELLKEYEE